MIIHRAYLTQIFPSDSCEILFDEGDIRVYKFYSKYIYVSKNAHRDYITINGERGEVYQDLLCMDINDVDPTDLTMEDIKIYLAFI